MNKKELAEALGTDGTFIRLMAPYIQGSSLGDNNVWSFKKESIEFCIRQKKYYGSFDKWRISEFNRAKRLSEKAEW